VSDSKNGRRYTFSNRAKGNPREGTGLDFIGDLLACPEPRSPSLVRLRASEKVSSVFVANPSSRMQNVRGLVFMLYDLGCFVRPRNLIGEGG